MQVKVFPVILVLMGVSLSVFGAEVGSIEESSGVGSAFRFSGTEHFIADNRNDPNDNTAPATNQVMNEVNVTGEYNNFSLNLDWTDRVGLDTYSSYVNAPFNLEKFNAKWRANDWEVIVGDTHQEIGRGVALSLYRDDVFGIDNTVQGVTAHYHPKGFDETIFGGRINEIFAPVAINPVDNTMLNRNVWIAGTSTSVDITKEFKVEGHYVLAMEEPGTQLTAQPIDAVWHTAGAIITKDNILEGVDLYVESNVLLSSAIYNGNSTTLPTGFGSFGSLVWSSNPWKVKWEIKDYRNDNFEFRRPPTLEEDLIQTLNVIDVTGSRWVVERKLDEHTMVTASYLVEEDRELGGIIHHGVVGGKVRLPMKLDVEVRGGYRDAPGLENMIHGSLKAKLPTAQGQSIELSALVYYYNQRLNLDPTPDDRHIFGLTYTFSEAFNTTVGYEYVPTNSPNLGNNFFNVGGTYKTGPLVARVFLGQTSGGTVCSGGVCRIVPPFTGGLLETTYTF
jgi:hypothetical protein